MKYLKRYNEDIDWDWVEEEEEPITNKLNKIEEKILKKDFPIIIKIHINYDDKLINLLNKYKIRNLGKSYYSELTGMVYYYIDKYGDNCDIGYMSDNERTILYNKEKNPHIEIIELT